MSSFELIVNPSLGYIKRQFKYLYNKGYILRNSNIPFWYTQSWSVSFESLECVIKIRHDRGEVFLHVSPNNIHIKESFDIRALVYYISNRKNIIQRFDRDFYRSNHRQIKWLSNLLRDNIDQILPVFQHSSYYKYKNDLMLAAQEYNLILARRI